MGTLENVGLEHHMSGKRRQSIILPHQGMNNDKRFRSPILQNSESECSQEIDFGGLRAGPVCNQRRIVGVGAVSVA